jgi:hypothetical protein
LLQGRCVFLLVADKIVFCTKVQVLKFLF